MSTKSGYVVDAITWQLEQATRDICPCLDAQQAELANILKGMAIDKIRPVVEGFVRNLGRIDRGGLVGR